LFKKKRLLTTLAFLLRCRGHCPIPPFISSTTYAAVLPERFVDALASVCFMIASTISDELDVVSSQDYLGLYLYFLVNCWLTRPNDCMTTKEVLDVVADTKSRLSM
jgi:hypothetical protein